MGDTLGLRRDWHGAARTRRAENWVALWTHGKGRFAMTNMGSQSFESAMYILEKQGLLDPERVTVLRTASSFFEPLPRQSPVGSVGEEASRQREALESNDRAGAPVMHEILAHWDRHADHVP